MSGADEDHRRFEDEDLPTGEFTESEKRRLRRLLRDQERMSWLWSSLRIWAAWATAAVGVLWGTHEYLLKILKVLFMGEGK